jgi:hypothetical protein
MLLARFPELSEMRVLDIGGEIRGWVQAPVRPAALVMLNTAAVVDMEQDVPWATRVTGDGCAPPASLDGEKFDLVYCNSVIEHVGGHQRRVELADTIHRLAPHHWVQTPYRYFPIEAHSLAPGLQFLPPRMQVSVLRHWPLGSSRNVCGEWPQPAAGRAIYPPENGQALANLVPYYAASVAFSVELLSRTEMKWLFPSSGIIAERVLGVPKSIIASI